jgi:hypothetical protein
MFLSGKDVTEDFDLRGLICFAFACYSGGTPKTDGFALIHGKSPAQLAPHPMAAYLPQRMLARGALAFIGHVDRAWSYSYAFPGADYLTGTFQTTLELLAQGYPAGYALEMVNERFLDVNNTLLSQNGPFARYRNYEPDVSALVHLGLTLLDARTYVLYGDPAARLRPEALS